jgi:hypothetical protein
MLTIQWVLWLLIAVTNLKKNNFRQEGFNLAYGSEVSLHGQATPLLLGP